VKHWIGLALVLLVAVNAGSDTPRPAESPKGPKIVVEPASFEFGQALQYKTLSKDFVIRNLGGSDLILEDIKTTCGCTAAVPGTKTLKGGGQTPLKVTLETRAALGRLERTVTIRSNDPLQPLLAVKLSVTVNAEAK
jgi:hypothetical protein